MRASQEQNELDKAYQFANELTLERFTSKLKKTPTADLSDLIRQQTTIYPQFRDSLAQVALLNAASSDAPARPESNTGSGLSPGSKPHGLQINDTVDVIYPISGELEVLVGLPGHGSGAPTSVVDDRLVQGLNEAIRDGEILWSLHNTFVLAIGPSAVVKISPCLEHDGVTNLRYVNAHAPEIPTPLCLGSLATKKRAYFFMSRAEGVTLESVWPQLSATNKLSVQAQLNDMFIVLRRKQPAAQEGEILPRIGSFESGICRDTRRVERVCEKAVYDESTFNDFLFFDARKTPTPWIRKTRSFMRDDHRIVWTHGDLHPRNIMVKWEDGEAGERGIRVTSLIDWELGGWYPEYWEFVKALSTINIRGPLADWCEYLPEAIGTWPLEWSVDSLISRWLG